MFEYVLTDKSGQHSLGDLRAIQDWILKYELKTVPDVSEVASVGGMVKEYQVILNPDRLRALNVTHEQVISAIQSANQEGGGSVLELGEAEYMVRTTGYLKSIDDFNQVVIAARSGVPVLLSDVASVRRDRRSGAASPSSTARARWRAG